MVVKGDGTLVVGYGGAEGVLVWPAGGMEGKKEVGQYGDASRRRRRRETLSGKVGLSSKSIRDLCRLQAGFSAVSLRITADL